MNYEKYEKQLKKVMENYYKKHFENPNDEFEIFLDNEFKKAFKYILKSYVRFFLLEKSLGDMRKRSEKHENLLELLHKTCNLLDYILEYESDYLIKQKQMSL